MFLNKTMFKKWIKNAFNHGGLVVGRVYDGLVLYGGAWASWTQEGYVPNWLKAAIMEHTGELPGKGQVFKAKKDEVQQYEMSENSYLNLPERYMEARVPFIVTPVIYDTKWQAFRLLQCADTQEIIAIPADCFDIIDYRELEGEERPAGPSARRADGDILIWKNEVSALAVCKTKLSEDTIPIMSALSALKMEGVE